MSRFTGTAVLFASLCVLCGARVEPAAADDKKTIAILEKQVAALKSDLQTTAQLNNALKQEVAALKTANAQLQASLKKHPTIDPAIKGIQTAIEAYRGAGLVHVVVLKLKSDSPEAEAQLLIDDTYAQLAAIKSVRGVWAGKPSIKGTPDGITDYTVGLVFLFDDAAGLKAYLNDSVHIKFADKHLKKWETPTVYDFEPKMPPPVHVDPSTLSVKTLQPVLDGYRGAGLVHNVILKLKADSSPGEVQALLNDASAQLQKIKAVRGIWVGKASAKGSPNASNDYNVGITILFDDAAGLKSYLNDPIHIKYTTNHIKKWEPTPVYDFEPKQPSP
jgi:hypothetical protein